jgi:hypothetical protein
MGPLAPELLLQAPGTEFRLSAVAPVGRQVRLFPECGGGPEVAKRRLLPRGGTEPVRLGDSCMVGPTGPAPAVIGGVNNHAGLESGGQHATREGRGRRP